MTVDAIREGIAATIRQYTGQVIHPETLVDDHIFMDLLNLRWGDCLDFLTVLEEHFHDLVPNCRVLFAGASPDDYSVGNAIQDIQSATETA